MMRFKVGRTDGGELLQGFSSKVLSAKAGCTLGSGGVMPTETEHGATSVGRRIIGGFSLSRWSPKAGRLKDDSLANRSASNIALGSHRLDFGEDYSRKKPNYRVIAAGTLVALAATSADAGWKPEYGYSPYNQWYGQQHDRNGWYCCEYGDAHPAHNAYLREGKWYVPIDGFDREIPPESVIEGPNPTGHGVVWYSGRGDHVTIFCFAPGPLS